MRIDTGGNITANFYMKGETPGHDSAPNIMPSQVHGKNILVINAANISDYALPLRPEADGILLTVPGVNASLRFADCAPVMIWGDSWVMILHSGYKGTALNISGEGLGIAREIFGDIGGACAWIGPCIGHEYFRKAGEEWTLKGINSFHRENFTIDGEKVYFSLADEIRSQLVDGGLRRENILLSGINTLDDSRCCSYRRGDIHERMTLSVKIQGTTR